jgi:hypothetical protein
LKPEIYEEVSIKVKSTHLKKQNTSKNKLNYHKLNKKPRKNSANKNLELHDFLSLNSCDQKDLKEVTSRTPTQHIEISARRLDSLNKAKVFHQGMVFDDKEMIRAMSHISFTNQTDMFDHYESQDSNEQFDRNTERAQTLGAFEAD